MHYNCDYSQGPNIESFNIQYEPQKTYTYICGKQNSRYEY